MIFDLFFPTRKRGVSDVVSDIQNNINELDQISTQCSTEIVDLDNQVETLIAQRNQTEAEQKRAMRIANKLSNLIQ